MRRSPLLALLAGTMVLVGCATTTIEASASAPAPSLIDLIAKYRTWAKVNPKPIQMEAYLSALCSGPPRWHMDGNPHDRKFITVYVNEAGKAAMLKQGSTKFPEGSIIVKEKLPSMTDDRVELLTVMVKRKRGFDTKHGDWEYFTANGKGTETSQENVAKCQSCHDVNKANDYVFRTYRTGAAQPKGAFDRSGLLGVP